MLTAIVVTPVQLYLDMLLIVFFPRPLLAGIVAMSLISNKAIPKNHAGAINIKGLARIVFLIMPAIFCCLPTRE